MAEAGAAPLLQGRLADRWPEVAHLLTARVGEGAHDRNAQQRLFWQVSGFLGALSEQQPLALLLDDLHWADRASLDLLQHLARHTRERSILLVATAREVEARSQYPLADALSDLNRDELVDGGTRTRGVRAGGNARSRWARHGARRLDAGDPQRRAGGCVAFCGAFVATDAPFWLALLARW
jgi:hypothetical protein